MTVKTGQQIETPGQDLYQLRWNVHSEQCAALGGGGFLWRQPGNCAYREPAGDDSAELCHQQALDVSRISTGWPQFFPENRKAGTTPEIAVQY